MAGYFMSQLLRLGSNLIMTRLLVPEMFGVMAIANVVLLGLQLFSDLGLNQNIIQSHRGDDTSFLNTIWTVQILRGGVLWLLTLLISITMYLLGHFHWWPSGSAYSEPVLPYIIAVLSFGVVISGFNSTKIATANRNLALRQITLINLYSRLTGVAVMVLWAWLDRTIWALVAGGLITDGTRMILSHLILPGEANSLHWDKTAFHEIFHFGKWIFLTSILGFLVMNGDRLILGGLIGASTLGLYAIAFFIINSIQMVFTKIASDVALPTLSEVARSRPATLKDAYYKFRIPIDVATLFALGFLFVAGHIIIQVLYDRRYFPAGHMVEILSIALFEIRYRVLNQCFISLGKPKLLTPILGVRLLALYGLMPLFFKWYGLDGAIWIAGGSALFGLPIVFYFKLKYGLCDFKKEFAVLLALAAGALLGWLVVQVAAML